MAEGRIRHSARSDSVDAAKQSTGRASRPQLTAITVVVAGRRAGENAASSEILLRRPSRRRLGRALHPVLYPSDLACPVDLAVLAGRACAFPPTASLAARVAPAGSAAAR